MSGVVTASLPMRAILAAALTATSGVEANDTVRPGRSHLLNAAVPETAGSADAAPAVLAPPGHERRPEGSGPPFGLPPALDGGAPPGLGGENPRRTPPGTPRSFDPRGEICGGASPLVGPQGQAGPSHAAIIAFNLPQPRTAHRANGSPWARMSYFWVGPRLDFVLSAHALAPTRWTLVAELGDGSVACLGSGPTDGGNLHLAGSVDPDSHLPPALDPFAAVDQNDPPADTRLQLLPSSAVDCSGGTIDWEHVDGYETLIGGSGLRFVDTDVLVCPAD